MLDNLCNSRTHFPKWQCGKYLWIDEDCGREVKNAHQILPGVGINPGLPAYRRVHHCHQGSGYLDDRNPAHKSGGDEAREVTNYSSSQRYDSRVAAVAFGEHLVGQPSPGIAGFVGFSGRDNEHVGPIPSESGADRLGVSGSDVGVGDYGVPVSRSDLLDDRTDFRQKSWRDPDGTPDFPLAYQVTSPAPVRTFATRASMKSRSESRFR